MLTYEYNIYDSERNRYLDQMLAEASFVWNHALALQKRYYSLFGKYIDIFRMKRHFAKRITRCRLRDRQWTCPDCGAILDRDLNAAENILRQGIASLGSSRKTKVILRKGR